MKITAIEEQKKHRDRLSVFVDGQFSFGVHLDVMLDFHLKVGLELTEAKIAEIKTADAFRQTYDKAIGFLARRPRSTKEVRQYLRDKLIYKHEEYAELASSDDKDAFVAQQQASIDQIISRLEDRQLLDDVGFAKWWIDNRRQFNPRGKRLLLLELKTKGISNQDIQTALTTPNEQGHFHSEVSEDQPFDETEAALAVARKYAPKYAQLPKTDQRQKITRYLASKGFDWDTIEQALVKLDAA